MTSYKIPQGTVDAARTILAQGSRLTVHQVHEIILRDQDANNDKPKVLHLIPIGATLGVAITEDGVEPADADILFVSMNALGNALPALGFTMAARFVPVGFLVHPPEDLRSAEGTPE